MPLPVSTIIREELEKRSDRDCRGRSKVELGEEPELQRLAVSVSKVSSKPTPLPMSTIMIREELDKRGDRDCRGRSKVELGEEPE